MKIGTILLLATTVVVLGCSSREPEQAAAPEPPQTSSPDVLAELNAEVKQLKAHCVPPRGTSLSAVSAQYGTGVRVTDPMSQQPAPSSSESRYWVFRPVTNASMLVHFDSNQKVTWAHYPHGAQNRAIPPALQVKIQERRDNIDFLKRIFDALEEKGIANK